jgi:hypothetical protein
MVRGIPCGDCNLTEGKLGNIETARRLLAYMEANEPVLFLLQKTDVKTLYKPQLLSKYYFFRGNS